MQTKLIIFPLSRGKVKFFLCAKEKSTVFSFPKFFCETFVENVTPINTRKNRTVLGPSEKILIFDSEIGN